MMCGGSLVIACLPTYAQIGACGARSLLLLAPAVPGPVGRRRIRHHRHLHERGRRCAGQRGFFSSFQYVTLIGGQLLAVVVVVVLQQLLDEAELKAWGWRIPFVLGAVAAVVALLLRRTLHRDRQYKDARRQGRRHHRRAVPPPQARLLHGAGLHGRRLADLLHLHHLHAEVPGELGRACRSRPPAT